MKWITHKATITILLIYILMQGIYHGARSATIWIYYMCQNKHTRQKSLRKYMRCWRSRLARLNNMFDSYIKENYKVVDYHVKAPLTERTLPDMEAIWILQKKKVQNGT
jgi:hypothetical protein